MNRTILLIDYENVQQIDLFRLDDSFQIIIFVGGSQKSVPIELVTNAQKLGSRIEWEKVEGNGRNALDFFIACHLGRVFERSPQLNCIVLSKDKGFDPLLRHLNKNGLKCKRINSLMELDLKVDVVDIEGEPNYKRVVELLRKSEKKSRPRRRKTLSQHISSMFQKNIEQKEIDRIIDILFANKMISETNNAISYEF
ncbi:MAG: PIN domain-containing protein [bacterium]